MPCEEKGTIFNIQKYSISDGPGIRTIVFLKGCPLRCKWCSNPESGEREGQIAFNRNLCVECGRCLQVCSRGAIRKSGDFGREIDFSACDGCGECIAECPAQALKRIGTAITVEEVVRAVRKDAVFYRKSGGGVTLSGGEPFAQPRFAAGLLRELKRARISTAVETTGAVPFANMERCLEDVDLFLFDVKHMDSAVHERYTGMGNAEIQQNLARLDAAGKRIWIRVPLISGVNDGEENMERVFALAESLSHVERVELLPYHDYGVGKYAQLGLKYELEGMKPPPEDRIAALLALANDRHPDLELIVRRHG